jgi:hypothetical protein
MSMLSYWTRALRRLLRPARPTSRRPGFRPRLDALEERCLLTAYTVTTTKDLLGDTTTGELTLRDALTAIHNQAASGNAPAGTANNTIIFAIGTSGSTQTINLTSPLPTLNHQVLLDGLSQGGSSNTTPLIVLNGAGAGAGANGLDLETGSDASTVRGLVIQGFSADGVLLNGTSNNVVISDNIGTDAAGTTAVGNGIGVLINGSARSNTVGGATSNTVGGAPVGGNVISGNGTASSSPAPGPPATRSRTT